MLRFSASEHYFPMFLTEDKCAAFSLELLGQPLIVRNINILNQIIDINTILVPDEYPNVIELIEDKFPSLTVKKMSDVSDLGVNGNANNSTVSRNYSSAELLATDFFDIPLNAVLHCPKGSDISVSSIIYPWDFLKSVKRTLEDITEPCISPAASIANSCLIDGPCLIEENVVVDDFCKIKGPTFIGSGSFIGMGSLVRNCMIGRQTKIGFNCELARSYFGGYDEIAHHNVILDSIIGKNVWFGGYTGTANVLLNRKNVRYDIGGGSLMDTGTNSFGAVVGDNVSVGASVIILPGRHVPSDSLIQAGTIYGRNKRKNR